MFHIINCGNENVILGTPWLEKVNPQINWTKRMVNIPDHTDRTPDYNRTNEIIQGNTTTAPTHANLLPKEYIREKPTYADGNFINYLYRENIAPPINKFKKLDGKFTAVSVNKTTIATEAGMMEVKLPERYEEFSSVFSEEEAHRFPPSRHQPQRLLHPESRKDLPPHPERTESHGGLPGRKPSTRKNMPLKFPPSCLLLLC